MGIEIRPAGIKAMASSMTTSLRDQINGLNGVLPPVRSFGGASLAGAAWTKAKNKLSYHPTIVEGMKCGNESLLIDCQKLSATVGSEDLIEDDIRRIIKTQQGLIRGWESDIASYRSKSRNTDSLVKKAYYAGCIVYRQALIACANMIISLQNLRLMKIASILAATNPLFQQGKELLDASRNAMGALASWDGSGMPPAVLLMYINTLQGLLAAYYASPGSGEEDAQAGVPDGTACGIDPVNMSTGNFLYPKTDLEIPGVFGLSFRRFYNALCTLDTPMGKGWTHNYHVLLQDDQHEVRIAMEDGHVETYARQADGAYQGPPEHRRELRKRSTGYELKTHEQRTYHFNAEGRFIALTDLCGNAVRLEYREGLLRRVESAGGALDFAYTEKGRLSGVTDHSGRRVSFAHSEEGRLVSVTQANGGQYEYEYDEWGQMTRLRNPMGVTSLENSYDAQGRTTEQRFADGGCFHARYDEETQTTEATEQNGNVVRYEHDDRQRTTRIVYTY